MNLFREAKLAILNCLSGERKTVEQWPFIVGDGDACDLLIEGSQSQCEISPSGREHVFTVHAGNGSVLLNGATTSTSALKRDKNYSLKVGDELFVFSLTKDPEKWFGSLATGRWMLQHKPTRSTSGPYAPPRLSKYFPDASLDGEFETVAFLQGANIGFFVESVRYIFDGLSDEPSSSPQQQVAPTKPAAEEEELLTGDEGSLTCPTCWLRFDPGDVKHIAAHEKMKGDSLMGPTEMRRFLAIRFTDNGLALDPMGIPTSDTACPHCHRRLPPDFLQIDHKIISVVGAPTSGKSYFLCVFTEVLAKALFKHFHTAFVDADPGSNAALTAMRDTLFGSASAAQARVAKTHVDDVMYERLTRRGRKVLLPKPFIFNLLPQTKTKDPAALIFYDNAGEQFQPGEDLHNSPGTLHLAASAGIIFLFDPTYSTEFRNRLPHHHDPQLKVEGHTDIQSTILTEAKVRVNRVLGLSARTKLDTPLAIVVGKFDVWRDLIKGDSLAQPLVEDRFDQSAVDENSGVVRELMLDVCPQIVAGAEAISNDVKYFPVSSFGCSPEITGYEKDPKGKDIPVLGPNPSKINPILVEVPVLWILSRIKPHLVPSAG